MAFKVRKTKLQERRQKVVTPLNYAYRVLVREEVVVVHTFFVNLDTTFSIVNFSKDKYSLRFSKADSL